MSRSEWQVVVNGERLDGSFDNVRIRELQAQGGTGEVLVWREGMARWTSATQVQELNESAPSGAASASPPPLPSTTGVTPSPSPVAAGPSKAPAVDMLRSLFDVSFNVFVTPTVMGVLYTLVIVAVLGGSGLAMLSGFNMLVSAVRENVGGMAVLGILWITITPVVAVVQLTLFRMLFELVLVLFKIKDHTAVLAGVPASR